MTQDLLGLGIDAGGTQTRWALADASGRTVAQGHVEGMTALQMGSPAGRERLGRTVAEIACAAGAHGRPTRVVAGMTGFAEGAEAAALAELIAAPFGLCGSAVAVAGDIEIAYFDAFEPGAGHLVYAGTGSVGAHVDAAGVCHRTGGHGGILDDGGSGFWIAVQALRHVWRGEDERPGSASASALGRELFARIGGSDWNATRAFVYSGGFEANRGKIGRLALAVAAAAGRAPADPADAAARAILEAAGRELARLATVLARRFGNKPVALSGRVFELHPLVEATVRRELPNAPAIERRASEAHTAAARIAVRRSAAR
jgi:N-acetylglucosamine kinase-like BadF-type ATPase